MAMESATPIKRYDNIAPVKAKIKANFSPNVSPARPKNGPPINCATAKTVCNCPNVVGSAPSFLDKYCKFKNHVKNFKLSKKLL